MIDTNLSTTELRAKLEESGNLPSLPTIVQDILDVTEDPRSGVKDVQAVVEKDQTCSVKLLKLSNSAYYGFSREISTIKQAILIIGLEGVKSAAMSLGMADAFIKGAKDSREVLTQLWVHSMAVATASQQLAKDSKLVAESVAYLAGLIHDFGKVILAGHFGERYVQVFERAKQDRLNIAEVEKVEFGVDHETVAAWVAQAWDLPEKIQKVVSQHHSAFSKVPINPEVLVVGIADALAYESGVGHGGNGQPTKLHDGLLEDLEIPPSRAREVVLQLRKEEDRFAVLLNV
jgi:putative nucleotidyltransferase with HDIG domain